MQHSWENLSLNCFISYLLFFDIIEMKFCKRLTDLKLTCFNFFISPLMQKIIYLRQNGQTYISWQIKILWSSQNNSFSWYYDAQDDNASKSFQKCRLVLLEVLKSWTREWMKCRWIHFRIWFIKLLSCNVWYISMIKDE